MMTKLGLTSDDICLDGAAILPPGIFHPTDIPERTLSVAGEVFLSGARVEIRDVANRLGVSRSTLHRQCGSREHLISATIWAGGRPILSNALVSAGNLIGPDRVVAFCRAFMEALRDHGAINQFLRNEPSLALRALVSRDSVCHLGALNAVDRLLTVEEARGRIVLPEDCREIAEEITDIAERSTYVDIIAGNIPSIDAACRAIRRLMTVHQPRHRSRPLAAAVEQ